MKYSERGKYNPFDAHMAGISIWITPRVILLLANMCDKYIHELKNVDLEAFLDFKEQIDYEASIKRDKYQKEILENICP